MFKKKKGGGGGGVRGSLTQNFLSSITYSISSFKKDLTNPLLEKIADTQNGLKIIFKKKNHINLSQEKHRKVALKQSL